MTLRYATSFDNLQDSDASGVFTAISQSTSVASTVAVNFNASYARWAGGKGLRVFSNQAQSGFSCACYVSLTFSAQSTWIVGAAVKPSVASNFSGIEIFALKLAASLIFELRFNGTQYFVSRNGTTLATGATISTTDFNFVEMKVVVHPSAGSYEVRLNGATYLSGTGLNTSGTGGTTADTLEMGGTCPSTGNVTLQYDDLYIADGTGAGVIDFVGDSRPIELLPNANGTFSDWTQTGGTGGLPYTAVNETPHNGDTSYLASTTTGQRTTLRYPALAASGQVKAVILAPWIKKDDANTHTVAARTYSSSTESTSSTTVQPSASYTYKQIVMETDPRTGAAWTVASVNATEYGLVVAS